MPRPLTATYRLQLSAAFTLHDARKRIPYLHRLGVSHLYLSPVLAARAGSTHGYDVADPTHVSQELGGEGALAALAEAAHAHDMGIVLDIVPNHMGIGPDNPYWDDLLAHGRASQFADWFDVDWHASTQRLAGKVLLPVLGDTLEQVIEREELSLDVSDQGVRIRYFDHHFPLDPAKLPPELELAMRDPSARELVRDWTTGAEGRARLRALLARQHYELAYWRAAERDLNYRRFFDVNELISLRVEQRDVFEATHQKVLQFVADGLVDGLRVDHVDGLLEPRRYLQRLRTAVDASRPAGPDGMRFPILVEKILAPGETLPDEWPVDGTTGYELMTTLEDVFIDPAGYAKLESRYRGARADGFRSVALESKRRVLRSGLNADVRRIAPMLANLAREAGWPRRTIAHYAGAIVELVAALPVYRTYLDAEAPEAKPRDRAVLEQALATVRERGDADAEATDALERALLGRWHDAAADAALARRRLGFVLRWQQLTGPAAAKGVEDTALYVYAPLGSRNEVGGDPGVPIEGAVERLHGLLAERAAVHPRSLNATNTHDTKRSADVRARLDALSEHSAAWERRLRHWRRRHRPLRTLVSGRLAPSHTTDNFIYQALVGIWPLRAASARAGEDDLVAMGKRLTAYIQKAVREAKVRTSWTDPDAEYEEAISRFIAALLDRGTSAPFIADVEQFASAIAPQATWNALARLVVHLTAPGVPDIYQGDELWFEALVDPDNRRPVDWEARERRLGEVDESSKENGVAEPAALEGWLRATADGRIKMYVTAQLLRFRRNNGAMMARKTYAPLRITGQHADRVMAYRCAIGAEECMVVVPRLTRVFGAEPPVGPVWGDTSITNVGADAPTRWRCVLTGRESSAVGGALRVADLLGVLPVTVLHATS